MSEPYPESSGTGNMLLKKEEPHEPHEQPIDCMRVMLQKIRACPTGKVTVPGDVVELMKDMKDMDRERAMIIHMSTKNSIIGVENISTGSLNAAIVHPRECIKGAILNNSANIIFVHNHPSGDPFPSVEDRATNKKLQEAFSIVGIDMLDSIIIGKEGYYSAKEHGEWFPESKYNKVGERRIMENKEDEAAACDIAMEAALSVIKERCGTQNDDELIETLERQATQLIENADPASIPGLQKQVQFHKSNKDAAGLLKLIEYLRGEPEEP